MLTTFDSDEYVYEALHAGASGFLLKDVRRDDLVHAVQVVARGDSLLAPSVARRLVEQYTRPTVDAARDRRPDPRLDVLTGRERETLLLLARYGDQGGPERRIPTISQETLAEMVGTTRSRVNFFMNKFRDLGFIEYNGDIKVNTSLLSVVLHD